LAECQRVFGDERLVPTYISILRSNDFEEAYLIAAALLELETPEALTAVEEWLQRREETEAD
jgi:HEAT repeat protein